MYHVSVLEGEILAVVSTAENVIVVGGVAFEATSIVVDVGSTWPMLLAVCPDPIP